MHRIAVNYFVLGVEKYTENQHEEALELLTVSYIVNDRIGEEPPNMPTPANKMMKLRGLMKHFHLAVEKLNTVLVNQFETGDDPGGVGERVARLIVPAIQILQARTHKQPGGRDATILEEVECELLSILYPCRGSISQYLPRLGGAHACHFLRLSEESIFLRQKCRILMFGDHLQQNGIVATKLPL